ncbi:MAG TPA: hypothetical protein PLD47_08270 [Aggregatilineales bacterium]|nr:hypothetical protein [Anaerolineales bacterium]HRE47705.1 hypothetical protein [Aggregatilineales bacterium]
MRSPRFLILSLVTLALILNMAGGGVPVAAAPQGDHPRLWLRPADVARLQQWAVSTNPFYAEGLLPAAERAKQDMDAGYVPAGDCGQRAYSEYVTEAYAELFAFLSLIDPDAAARADYAARARTLLMHVMDIAALGPAEVEDFTCPGDPDSRYYPPFRHPDFFTEDSDRPRWYGEAFALTVDWIYPSLSAEDKATIAKVFTRWGREIIERAYHHPEPVGVVRSAELTANRTQVRWSGNNYFAAHMRNLGLLSMALDPVDSTPELQGYLENAVGAWLYLFEANTRTEVRGGVLPEGFEYSPQTASYVIQFLWALKTAGYDAATAGAWIDLDANPFWDDFITAYLHSLSPATVYDPELDAAVYQPAWYGDAQRYHLADFIDAFGALGAYDQITGNAARLNALRWIQMHTPAGGAAALVDRARGADYFRSTILYFMLFDPAASPPTDPRPAMPPDYVAAGMQRLFSRTGWDANAAWLIYNLSWNEIDHQHAEGNHLEFYRGGEWLTKARVGYANIAEGIASSEFRNTLAIQNERPADRDDSDWRIDLWQRGSQWNLVNDGDPGVLLHSANEVFTYAAGDATNLYNSTYESSTAVRHASRAIVWLKPDWIVVYDRADAPAQYFKRVWWQLPNTPTLSGTSADLTTTKGQHLFISALLPEGATMHLVDSAQDNVGETVATGELMTERIVVEAPATDSARFLHVLQGADAGTAAAPAVLIRSTAGSPFEGAALKDTVVLFPVAMSQPFEGVTYTAPAGTTRHLITGLTAGVGYTVTLTAAENGVTVTVAVGGTTLADGGGVLTIR